MSSNNEILKVDISKEDILQTLLNFLKDYFPETLYMWHLLWYIQHNFISIHHIHPEVFLNDLKEIKSIIIIYSLYGFSNIKQKTKYDKFIIFHCDNNSIHLLESMMKQCLPWNTSTKFVITANGKRFLSMLEQFHKNIKNEKFSEIEHCFVMEIDRSTLEEVKLKIEYIPNDIDIRQLSVIDADLINNYWNDKSEDSLGQIKYQIEHLPTLGAYRHGKLISWRLLQYNGSLGMAYTIDNERRQGLSSILNIKLAEKVFQMQDHIFCTVLKRNLSSIQLLTKLGYRSMASYFDEHNCEPLQIGEEPNHLLDLARLLLDSGIGAEFQLEFERIFGDVDGRKQPPAAKHIIENLVSTNNFDRDEKCPICLKEFQLNSTKELSCHHKYCENCIIQWLKLVNTCPMCRIELPTDDQDYEQYKKQKQRLKQRQLELDDLHNSMFS